MAIKGMYVADGITTYTTADVKLINSKFANNKIVWGENDLKVTAQSSPAMAVKVSSGVCSINGALLQNTASYTIDIESNIESYPRIDAIVAYISGTTRQIKVLKGTANPSPSAPSTTSSSYVKLAEVYVGVGVSAIQTVNVTDSRKTNNQTVINNLLEEINSIKEFNTENQLLSSLGRQEFLGGLKVQWGSFITTPGAGAGDVWVEFSKSFTTCVYADFVMKPATPDVVDTSNKRVEWNSNRLRVRFTGARQENHAVYWFALGW